MAINPSTNATMSGRVTAADASYPRGSSQDETSPGAGDGTPYFKARADDIFGFQQALLELAGIVPSGNADTALVSEYLQGVIALAMGVASTYTDTGAADVYVGTLLANQQAPAFLLDGMKARIIPANDNTGASTLNVAGTGVVNIRRIGGVGALSANDLQAGIPAEFTYRTAPAAHWEFSPDRRNILEFNASGNYTPNVGVKSFRVILTGGGGGGSRGTDGGGGGGASGGESIKEYQVSELTYPFAFSLGGGGAGGNTTAGGTGGTSSFSGQSAVGGGGASISNRAGGTGGTASGGDLDSQGGAGYSSTDTGALGGNGGSNSVSQGGRGALTGASAGVRGSGGGGTDTAATGGAGGAGVLIIEERF